MFGGRGTTSILAVRDAPGTKASRTRKIRKRERCNLYRVGSVPKRPCRCFSGVVYFSRQGFVAPRTRPCASAVPHCLKLSKARQRREGHRLTRQSASPLRTHPAEARTPTQRLRPDFTPGSGTPRPDPLRQDGQRWLLLLGRTHRNYSNQLPRPPLACLPRPARLLPRKPQKDSRPCCPRHLLAHLGAPLCRPHSTTCPPLLETARN